MAKANKRSRTQDLSSYKGTYLSFVRAIHQTQLVSAVAEYSFRDFPRHLPSAAAGAIRELFNQVASALLTAASGAGTKKANRLPNTVRVRKMIAENPKGLKSSHDEASQIAMHALYLMLAQDLEKKRPAGVKVGKQFQILARHQTVAMLYAHVDAFFADTLRLICRVKPEVLRTGKQLTWETVLGFHSIESLVGTLAEQFIYGFGWKTLKERLKFLRDKFGLDPNIPAGQLELLILFEQRRHLIIHNGGVVTAKYVADAHDKDANIGRQLLISREEIRSLGHAVMMLGSELCSKVAVQFLNAKPADLTRIWKIAETPRKRTGQ